MYNGIGLATPRGSGTSGFIQRNLSYVKNPHKTKEEFLKELQQLKDNVLPPPKKANPEIVKHQQKREILLMLLKMREELEAKGTPEEEIEQKINKAEKKLNEKLENGDFQAKIIDSHQEAIRKEKEYQKLKQTFQIDENYKPGSAFDFEQQNKERMEKKFEIDLKKKNELEKKREQKKLEKKIERKKEKEERKKEKKLEKLKKKEEKKLRKKEKKRNESSDSSSSEEDKKKSESSPSRSRSRNNRKRKRR